MPAWCGSTNVTRHASASRFTPGDRQRDRGDHFDLADARVVHFRPLPCLTSSMSAAILRRHAHPDLGRRRRDDGCHRLCALRQAAAAAALLCRLRKLQHQLAQTPATPGRGTTCQVHCYALHRQQPTAIKVKQQARHAGSARHHRCCCSTKPRHRQGIAPHAITPPRARAEHPSSGFNVAAIPGLLQAECFGAAQRLRGRRPEDPIGKFGQPTAAPLFLDEIGDMPLTLQAKSCASCPRGHEVSRSAATKVVRSTLRVIAATSRDLKADVAAGRIFPCRPLLPAQTCSPSVAAYANAPRFRPAL